MGGIAAGNCLAPDEWAMQLTKHTDYALRVLMFLAHRTELATISEVAAAQGIPESHLMKIVSRLSRHGFLETLRGKGGGMKLAHAPERISVGEVVRVTEETLDVLDCLARDYRGSCCLAPSCRLKAVLRDAQHAFLRHLDDYTLEDLLPNRGRGAAPSNGQRPTAIAAE
jgi:Rrf2 family nitric oxide-sensitive transcriptional repressor